MPTSPAQPFASFVQGLDAALSLKRMKLDQKRQDLAQEYHEQLLNERQQAAEMRQETAANQLEAAKQHNEEMFQSNMARLKEVQLNNEDRANLRDRYLTDLESKNATIEAQQKQNEADKVANETAATTLKKSVADANQKAQMFREANDNRAAAIREGLPTLQINLKRLDALRADPTYNTDPSKQTEATRLMQENKKLQDSFNVPMPSAADDLKGAGNAPSGSTTAMPAWTPPASPPPQPLSLSPQPAAAALTPLPQAAVVPGAAPSSPVPQKVRVVDANGQTGYIPANQLQDALQQGYKPYQPGGTPLQPQQ